jgi:hypothetical protein
MQTTFPKKFIDRRDSPCVQPRLGRFDALNDAKDAWRRGTTEPAGRGEQPLALGRKSD